MNPRKRGLGRGLDALIEAAPAAPAAPTGPAASVATEEAPPRSLPVESLKPNRFQPRTYFDEAGIAELSESIRIQGLVQPIVVSPEPDGSYSIIAGERRWRAARRAGLENVPVVIREVSDDGERLELALVENLQRSDLNPVEEAEAYLLLQEKFSLSQEEVASRVGKARTTVTNALRLLKLPEEVRELLRDGRLTAGQARPLLSLTDPDEQIALAQRAIRESLSARDLERLVAAPKVAPKPPKPPVKQEVHAAAAEEKLTRRLQTRVEIKRRGKGGDMRIHFHSEEELMRLYDLLMERED
ncbi:MAG TPA: ParB/RepB/Spo0J family partition protein [Thermoanaerobaculia bacterium]|nr:ParB/RepB/Spo0J family partition protein [Thermoanaerobaculia bacterium]